MSLDGVSRETERMLRHFADLLLKWTKRINLVAPSTEPRLWDRHIMDCLHAVQVPIEVEGHWMDIGSGGGLPGLVAAILHRDRLSACTLVESDQRKCAFLRTAARELHLNVEVRAERVESLDCGTPDILSARALAPLDKLLDLTTAFHESTSDFLFMKGRNWEQEVEQARGRYRFSLETHPSVTETESAILLISNVEKLSHGQAHC